MASFCGFCRIRARILSGRVSYGLCWISAHFVGFSVRFVGFLRFLSDYLESFAKFLRLRILSGPPWNLFDSCAFCRVSCGFPLNFCAPIPSPLRPLLSGNASLQDFPAAELSVASFNGFCRIFMDFVEFLRILSNFYGFC